MRAVILDIDAIRDAETSLSQRRAEVRAEADRHASLANEVEGILHEMAGVVLADLNPANWFDPLGPWERWGLSRYSDACQTSHAIINESRGAAHTRVLTLGEAHGVYGGAIVDRATEALSALDHATNAAWDVVSFFDPGRLLTMLENPWSIGSLLSTARDALGAASQALSEFVRYLDRLYQREDAVINDVLRRFGSDVQAVYFGSGRAIAALSGAASSEGQRVSKSLLEYLGQHYHGATDVSGFDARRPLDSPHATGGVSGHLMESKVTLQDHILSAPVTNESGFVVGDLSGLAGAQVAGAGGALLGIRGSFAAATVYDRTTVGSKQFGLTSDTEASVGTADGYAGYSDGSLGASVGVSLATVQDSVGANIAGVNVGINGSIGLKAELGFELGKHVEVKLPFVSFGFSVDNAQ